MILSNNLIRINEIPNELYDCLYSHRNNDFSYSGDNTIFDYKSFSFKRTIIEIENLFSKYFSKKIQPILYYFILNGKTYYIMNTHISWIFIDNYSVDYDCVSCDKLTVGKVSIKEEFNLYKLNFYHFNDNIHNFLNIML